HRESGNGFAAFPYIVDLADEAVDELRGDQARYDHVAILAPLAQHRGVAIGGTTLAPCLRHSLRPIGPVVPGKQGRILRPHARRRVGLYAERPYRRTAESERVLQAPFCGTRGTVDRKRSPVRDRHAHQSSSRSTG